MDEELFDNIERVIALNHKISSYLIELAKEETKGKVTEGKNILSNPILNNLFQNEQEYLRKINKKVLEISEEEPYNLELIEEIKEAIEQIEMQLRYIPRVQTEFNMKNGKTEEIVLEPSIYQDDEYNMIRVVEQNMLMQNIDYIDKRANFRGDLNELTFYEKGLIILDVSEKRFFKDFAIPEIEKKYKGLEINQNKERKNLIKQKYSYYYQYLNSLYNGILQKNDISFFKSINKFIEYDALQIMLELSEDEIEKNILMNLEEPKDTFKNNMKIILGPTREKIKEQDIKKENEKIKNEKIKNEEEPEK